ncbi:hypothetical protein GN244_ATG05880 [Phytophthora infestans]|nr:hypothetical protein GN244_ATG05880 [Phytophthora infestans]KAF4135670.1 hypothetical protein GN958_ATG15132 [Phytophthora infestans]
MDLNISGSTLSTWVRNAKNVVTRQRRGPKPLLPTDAADAIQEWVVGRQVVRQPVGRAEIK